MSEGSEHDLFQFALSSITINSNTSQIRVEDASARFLYRFSARGATSPWPIADRGFHRSRHEDEDMASISTSSSIARCARSCAASELSELRGAPGRHAVGRASSRFAFCSGLRAGAGQGDADADAAKRWRARTRCGGSSSITFGARRGAGFVAGAPHRRRRTSARAATTMSACSSTWRGARSSTWPTARTPRR